MKLSELPFDSIGIYTTRVMSDNTRKMGWVFHKYDNNTLDIKWDDGTSSRNTPHDWCHHVTVIKE